MKLARIATNTMEQTWHEESQKTGGYLTSHSSTSFSIIIGLLAVFNASSDRAGAYHSRTPKYVNRYKERFDRYRAKFLHEDADAVRMAEISTMPIGRVVPTFPFLQTGLGGGNALGSLVALSGASSAQDLLIRAAGSS